MLVMLRLCRCLTDCYYIRVHVVTFTPFVLTSFIPIAVRSKESNTRVGITSLFFQIHYNYGYGTYKYHGRCYYFILCLVYFVVRNTIVLTHFAVALVERPSSADLGVQLVDSERSGRKTQSDLVELATQIQTADAFTRSNVCNKLQVIADQVRFLHEQARRILEETKEAENLHHLAW